ncbi:MAG: hypothetical protein ACE5IJ_11895, partial [Thermoplasmata archaeon]
DGDNLRLEKRRLHYDSAHDSIRPFQRQLHAVGPASEGLLLNPCVELVAENSGAKPRGLRT